MKYTNPFTLDTVRLPLEKIINRDEQVEFLNDRILNRKENLLLTGQFGIGKTCLLRKFRGQLDPEQAKQTLLIEMEMGRVSSDASGFLADVLLELIGVFWGEVLKRPCTDLIKAVSNPRSITEAILPQVRRVLDLYRILRPEKEESRLQSKNVAGVDKILKATKEESISKRIIRGDLTPSEFVGLADELLIALRQEGIERTIVFGDEANHIDPGLEIELFQRNFEIFAKRNVQFVFTAKADVLEKVPRLRDAFPAWLNLGGFKDPSILNEVIRKSARLHLAVFEGQSSRTSKALSSLH